MLEELIELGIVGVASTIIVGLMYNTERRFIKFSTSDGFQSKGIAAVYVIMIAIVVGYITQEIPSILEQQLVSYYIQSAGFILAGGWVAVHQMVTNWNLELPSADDPYETIILVGIAMFLIPFVIN